MLNDFKAFLLRGNVVDLAVAVVIGAAFGAVVLALVEDLITPLIAMIFGKPDFAALDFTINDSTASRNGGGFWMAALCPALRTTFHSAPGISRLNSREALAGIMRASLPSITSVGSTMRRAVSVIFISSSSRPTSRSVSLGTRRMSRLS